jgi:hypothetical protein
VGFVSVVSMKYHIGKHEQIVSFSAEISRRTALTHYLAIELSILALS